MEATAIRLCTTTTLPLPQDRSALVPLSGEGANVHYPPLCSDCPGWTSDGECFKNPGFMYKECPNSCGVCEGVKRADKNATQCEIWADAGECINNPLAVMKECPDSCGVCTTVCNDHDESCKGWTKAGECETNKAFMHRVCPASCGVCQILESAGDKEEL